MIKLQSTQGELSLMSYDNKKKKIINLFFRDYFFLEF